MKAIRVRHVSELWGDDAVNGGYCQVVRDGEKTWMVRTPNGHLGDLSAHSVVENGDGTITVSPSILVSDHTGELYHGWLIDGEWRP